jgi:uncharacterized protein (TIGR04255 family)
MSGDKAILKNPPAKEVQLGVQFAYKLEVAEQRARFHNLVKQDFPWVVPAEPVKLQVDLGDYSLHSQNIADRLEISMGYFRFVTNAYPGFARFSERFLGYFDSFVDAYALADLTHFYMKYTNSLQLPVGRDFDSCFTLRVAFPEGYSYQSYVAKGVLVVQQPDGYVVAEFDPQVEADRVTAYNLVLSFAVQKNFQASDIRPLLDTAHGHLRKFFFAILREEYLEYLEGGAK